jgi:hypothetical protein
MPASGPDERQIRELHKLRFVYEAGKHLFLGRAA